jgi:DNA polymerase
MGMQFDLFDTGGNEVLNAQSYAEFKKLLTESNCARCALSKSRTNIVVDRGNPESKILAIGEGPGENEDLQGKAFVGRAGRLMDKMMEDFGIDTNGDMLIANVVKCRAPANRVPHAGEAEACMPFLKRQIELVQPAIVLLLGATSLKHMDSSRKKFSMAEEAGTFFTIAEYPDIEFMVLYHPAAVLRNPNLDPKMREHIRRLCDRARELGVLGA